MSSENLVRCLLSPCRGSGRFFGPCRGSRSLLRRPGRCPPLAAQFWMCLVGFLLDCCRVRVGLLLDDCRILIGLLFVSCGVVFDFFSGSARVVVGFSIASC